MKTDRSYGTFAVLRHGAFRWIWAGAMLSNVGNWMEAVAQSWLVQQQTASPFMVELLAASEFVPHALLMLAASIEGQSTILNADPIKRAHPRFVENLESLGADVDWDG